MSHDFSTTLLREKFVIKDTDPQATEAPVVALSNRMVVSLNGTSGPSETFVIRTQNMHSCVRMAARIAHAHADGPLMLRSPPFEWAKAWESVVEGYERQYNPNIWGAVYHEGKPVFSEGSHHPFLDIVEGFDFKSMKTYAEAISIAEDAFRQAGKHVRITHDSNVALVVNVRPKQARVGVILRGAARTATFNFTAKPRGGTTLRPSPPLGAAAAFLEGVQLAFQVGSARVRRHYGLIEAGTEEARKLTEGEARLSRLSNAIRQFDQGHDVFYRPECPEFHKILVDAEDIARKTLAPQIEEKIRSGEIDQSEWVL